MLAEYKTTSSFLEQINVFANSCEPIEKDLQPASLKTTFDCGVQTNLSSSDNPENAPFYGEDMSEKKKMKRREYKKRRKVRRQLMQRENREEFEQIIDLFYERQAKFVDYSDRLEELVCSFNQDKFKHIFDSILKKRVDIIRNSIWEYTQAILEENPSEMPYDHPFFLDMADHLYRQYKLIEKSSQEAEHVIYIYLTLNSHDQNTPIAPQDLGRRTFRYLIDTDKTLKKLIHMCDKRISLVRVQERLKLEVIINKLRNFRQNEQNNFFTEEEDFEDYEDSYSSCSEEDYQEDEKSTTSSENSEYFSKAQQRLFQSLESFVIKNEEKRLECNIDQEFGDRMKKYREGLRGCFKKPTQFDKMNQYIETIKPCRPISKEFKRIF